MCVVPVTCRRLSLRWYALPGESFSALGRLVRRGDETTRGQITVLGLMASIPNPENRKQYRIVTFCDLRPLERSDLRLLEHAYAETSG
jgi:hypothetical protein